MTKGSYAVGEDAPSPPRKDTSYRSFICALLIFLCICLIVLLASINWGGKRHKHNLSDGGEKSAHTGEDVIEDDRRNDARRNQTHEKIRMYDGTTTEKKIIIKEIEPTEYFEEKDQTTAESRIIGSKNEIEDTTKVPYLSEKESYSITPDNKPQVHTSTLKDSDEDKQLTTEVNKLTTEVNQLTTETNKLTTEANQFTTKANQERIESRRHTTIDSVEDGQTSTEESQWKHEELSTISTKEIEETTMEAMLAKITATEESALFTKINSTTNPTTILETITTRATQTTKDTTYLTTTEQDIESTTTEPTLEQQNQNRAIFPKIISSTTEKEETTTVDSTEPTKIPEPSALVLTTTLQVDNKTEPSSTSTSTSTTEITIMESESEYMTEPTVVTTKSSTSPPLTKTSNPVCETAICKTVSSQMLSMMNHSAEPCDDFYDFACGHAYHTEEESSEYQDLILLHEQLSKINESSPKFVKMFKGFYQSCLSHEDGFHYQNRMKKLEVLLEEVGQFQFNEPKSIDLTDLVTLLVLRQSMPLFDIGLDLDKGSSNLILQLNLPHQSFLRTGLEDWSGLSSLKKHYLQAQQSLVHEDQISLTDVYSLFESCQSNYSSYLDSVEDVLRDLGAFSSLTPKDLYAEIKEIRFSIEFDVLNNLDSLPSSANILKTFVKKTYGIRRIADLQQHFGVIDWKKLFTTVTRQQIQDSTLVQVYFADYFQDVFSKLKNVDQKKLNNAFLAIYAYDLFFNTVIPKGQFGRDRFCMDLSKKLLPDVWTYFVQNAVPKIQQDVDNTKATQLFEELKRNFCKSLNDAEWIEDNTKVTIANKCNNLNLVVFTALDSTSLFKNYKDLNITHDYQTNLVHSLENFKRMVYSTQGTPISANTIFSYFLDPLGLKPLTFYSNPMIAVPLGLMRKAPIGLPDYMVKTRAGFSIARQLARHFDPTGMDYGIVLKSTSESSYFEFVETMKSLMDYSSPRIFNDKNISFALNGSLSINERIVDNAAFRLIYDSANFNPNKDLLPWISGGFSREKVFFIAMAQEMCKKTSMLDFMLQVFEKRHLPAVLRVENVIGNSQQFAQQFMCPDGSGMDFPEKMQFPFLPKVEPDYEEDEDDINLS